MLALSVPVAYSLGLSSVLLMVNQDIGQLLVVPQKMVAGIDAFVFLAIPMFTLAGFLMECGGISKRLVKWAEMMFGRVPGSTGAITIITCMIFAALTGSGPATVAAIGGIMMPSMLGKGYPQGDAAALVVAGGGLGPDHPAEHPYGHLRRRHAGFHIEYVHRFRDTRRHAWPWLSWHQYVVCEKK
jgi:C4-dicarboxylate transporter DctM subunit